MTTHTSEPNMEFDTGRLQRTSPAMEILPTEPRHTAEVLRIYDRAREFMRRSGNAGQWADGYPSADTLAHDIRLGWSRICVEEGRIVGTFCFALTDEPTYRVIHCGAWLDDRPYGVIHRVASDGTTKGLMHRILDHCFRLTDNIRIDTHRDNAVMRGALTRYGFSYCGIIHLANGDERLAYQLGRDD